MSTTPVRTGPAAGSAPPGDPLIAALARYVEALHRRYPDGPDEMRRERLAVAPDSAKVVAMIRRAKDPAA